MSGAREAALGVTVELPETVSSFYRRPFWVIHGERIARIILDAAKNPDVQRLAEGPLIGGVDFSNSTDLRKATLREKLLTYSRYHLV